MFVASPPSAVTYDIAFISIFQLSVYKKHVFPSLPYESHIASFPNAISDTSVLLQRTVPYGSCDSPRLYEYIYSTTHFTSSNLSALTRFHLLERPSHFSWDADHHTLLHLHMNSDNPFTCTEHIFSPSNHSLNTSSATSNTYLLPPRH